MSHRTHDELARDEALNLFGEREPRPMEQGKLPGLDPEPERVRWPTGASELPMDPMNLDALEGEA